MEMKNVNLKFLLIISILLGLIFWYGCVEKKVETGPIVKKNETAISNQTQPKNESDQTNYVRCEDLKKGKEKCIIERAYNNNKIEDCELLLSDEFDRGYYVECIIKMSEYNYTFCSRLNGSERDICFRKAADKFGDSACNMIENSSLRNDCILREYSEKCRLINDSYNRTLCDAVEKREASICRTILNSTARDECYLNYSITLNENACENISSEAIKRACESIISKNLQCGLIQNEVVKDYCYLYYAVYTSSCSWCNVIKSISYKDDCYQRCVLRTKDMNFCREISTEQKRDSCYWEYAHLAKDVEGCDKIKTLMLKRVCVQNVAKMNSMPSECEILLNTSAFSKKDVSDCYIKVIAESQVSFQNCIKMNDGYYKDQCIYMAIRREKLATDYCAFIIDNALRNECLKQ